MKTKFKLLSPIVFALFALSSCNFLNKDNDWQDVRKEIEGDDAIMPTSISLNVAKVNLIVGQSSTINASFTPTRCNKNIKWYTSEPTIVSVDDEGNITGRRGGNATVTAVSVNGLEAKCEVEVTDLSVNSIKVDSNNVTVVIFDTYKIENATVEPYTPGAKIGYTVPLNSVSTLSVDKNGVVRTFKEGIGTVIVYYDVNEDGRFNQNNEVYTSITFNIISGYSSLTPTNITATYYPKPKSDLTGSQNITITKFNVTKSVPYISTAQLNTVVKKYLNVNYGVSESSTLYTKYSAYYAFEMNGGSVRFYPDRNQVILHDWHKYASPFYGTNNDLTLDPCTPLSSSNLVESPTKTKLLKTHSSDITINLGEYSLRIFEYNNLCYIPFDLAMTLVLHDMGSLVFDGKKIFEPSLISANYGTQGLYPTYYNSSTSFAYYDENYGKLVFTKKDLTETEAATYKYIYQTTNVDDYGTYINGEILFKNDGNGTLVCGTNTTGVHNVFRQDLPKTNKTFSYTEPEGGGNISVTFGSGGGSMLINKQTSDFASNVFGEGYKMYAFNCFALKLDYFYGLKYTITHTRINEYFREAEMTLYKNSFASRAAEVEKIGTVYDLVTNANTVDEYSKIIAGIFAGLLGDGHSSWTGSSLQGTASTYTENAYTRFSYSDRIYNLSQRYSTLSAAKKTAYSTSTVQDRFYSDTNNTFQILQFSSFAGSVIPSGTQLTTIVSDANVDYSSNSASDGKNGVNEETFKNIAKRLSALSEVETCKDIVFDITLNGGGSVRQLPQILGLMTTDPTVVVRNTLTGGVTEFHYLLDLDGDGNYGTSTDTFKGRFKFYILQSSYSFSCASAFSASAKLTRSATILGDERSGGGSCVVGSGTDALGNTYTYSSSLEFMMPGAENELESDDEGVIADQIIEETNFYKPAQLLTLLPNKLT